MTMLLGTQLKAPPIQGSTIAAVVDRMFLSQNFEAKHLSDTRDVLYPRDNNVTIKPGQVLLGRRDISSNKWGIVPSPAGFSKRFVSECYGENVEDIRKYCHLDASRYKVMGIAATESTEWEKGKLMSVVSKSPSTGFLNTGRDWILDGQTVCIRLPNHQEVEQHTNRFGCIKFTTYAYDHTDIFNKIDDFIDYLTNDKIVADNLNAPDKKQCLMALTSILSACGEFFQARLIPSVITHEFGKWKQEGYEQDGGPIQLFIDESRRIPLQHLLNNVVKLSDTMRANHDHLILGIARQDVKPYGYGKLEMFV